MAGTGHRGEKKRAASAKHSSAASGQLGRSDSVPENPFASLATPSAQDVQQGSAFAHSGRSESDPNTINPDDQMIIDNPADSQESTELPIRQLNNVSLTSARQGHLALWAALTAQAKQEKREAAASAYPPLQTSDKVPSQQQIASKEKSLLKTATKEQPPKGASSAPAPALQKYAGTQPRAVKTAAKSTPLSPAADPGTSSTKLTFAGVVAAAPPPPPPAPSKGSSTPAETTVSKRTWQGTALPQHLSSGAIAAAARNSSSKAATADGDNDGGDVGEDEDATDAEKFQATLDREEMRGGILHKGNVQAAIRLFRSICADAATEARNIDFDVVYGYHNGDTPTWIAENMDAPLVDIANRKYRNIIPYFAHLRLSTGISIDPVSGKQDGWLTLRFGCHSQMPHIDLEVKLGDGSFVELRISYASLNQNFHGNAFQMRTFMSPDYRDALKCIPLEPYYQELVQTGCMTWIGMHLQQKGGEGNHGRSLGIKVAAPSTDKIQAWI